MIESSSWVNRGALRNAPALGQVSAVFSFFFFSSRRRHTRFDCDWFRRVLFRSHAVLDVFTLSSWSEGTSLGLLEAMSTGVCPVVTEVGGSPAILGERLRHRLVRPGDVAALAAAWRDALAHPDRREADGAVARERVEQAFGLDRMVRQYEHLYNGGE